MAKKKNTIESKVSLSGNNAHPLQSVYRLLAITCGLEPGDIKIRYSVEGGNVTIAIPRIKYAIAFEGDDFTPLKEKGWHIENISYSDIEPFARVFFSIDAARVASIYSKADPNIKNTSKPEEKLMSEIVRRMLPVPDRNYKFVGDDGREITTPDFTWEDEKIAFFMDGAYWHSVQSDQQIMKEIQKSKNLRKDIANKRKDKVRNDGKIRSQLGMRGWIVLSCTDEDIEHDSGVHEVVDMIEEAIKQSRNSRNIQETNNEETDKIIDDLLSDNNE